MLSARIQQFTDSVQSLYSFRDRYFENNDIDKAGQKADDVKAKLVSTLEIFDSAPEEIKSTAEFNMLRGKALNVESDHSSEAEEVLSRAVKLDPKLTDAWVQLGESYWKKNAIEEAKNCFIGALNHKKDKVALRSLSMVMRQEDNKDPEKKLKQVEESVERAKEAVQLDIADGTSWFILGNAYLSLFFAHNQNPKLLKQCMVAYQNAEKDSIAKNNPDLHYNRATAYRYLEQYQDALEGYTRANALDPGFGVEQEKALLVYLRRVYDLVTHKGRLRPKKLALLAQSIHQDKDLGPYSGGSYTAASGKSVTLDSVTLNALRPEANLEKVAVGKVVCTVVNEEIVPVTFCVVDQAETCVAVTCYNVAQGCGVKIGDSVAIPEPVVKEVKVSHKGEEFSFRCLRVDTPLLLVVNGRKLGRDKQAPSVLTVSTFSE